MVAVKTFSAIRRTVRICCSTLRVSLALAFAVAAVALIGAAVIGTQHLRRAGIDIANIPALTDPSKARLPEPVRYIDRDGEMIGQRGVQKRTVLPPGDIPDVLRNATIAIEDQRFMRHRGVDFQSVMRAVMVDVKTGTATEGASTITMQYIRNVYLSLEKTAHRKVSEVALALELETVWDKPRILTAYLNTVFYGEGAYGAEAAARTYFGKRAKDLSTAEAAMLAGIVQQPSKLNPRQHLNAAIARRNVVLDEMYAQGMISRSKVLSAKRSKVRLRKIQRSEKITERSLLHLLEDETKRLLPEREFLRGGFTVKATFSLKDIRASRKKLRQFYANVPARDRPVVAAAFVENSTGRILTLAHNKGPTQFDYSFMARRQPGSTVKAFTAGAYLQSGGRLSDPIDNSPLKVNTGARTYTVQPTTSGSRDGFDMLRFSQNPAAWRLFQKAGPQRVLDLEKDLGVNGMDANAAAALGGVKTGTNPREMAGAFAALGAEGAMQDSHAVLAITDQLNNEIWDDSKLKKKSRLEGEYARQLTVGLRRTVTHGMPMLRESLNVADDYPVAGKTGTSENHADAWFAGYTPKVAGAVWTGYGSSRKSLEHLPGGAVWGSTIPARAFSSLSTPLLKAREKGSFARPTGVQRVPDVVGRDHTVAQQQFARARFSAVSFTSEFSATKKPGSVISQSVRSGTWVVPSHPIVVTYATDVQPTPDLVGSSFVNAEKTLGTFVKLRYKFRVDENSDPGTVLEQSPTFGDPMRHKSTVTLTVATTPGPVRVKTEKVPYVPDDSELAELRRQLATAKSQVRELQDRPDPEPPAPQDPATVVPRVVGLHTKDARTVVESLGLKLKTATGQSGIVTGQDINPGSAVPGRTNLLVTVE